MPLKLPATSMPKPLNKLGHKVIGNWCARFGGMGGPYRGSKGLHNWLAKSSFAKAFRRMRALDPGWVGRFEDLNIVQRGGFAQVIAGRLD